MDSKKLKAALRRLEYEQFGRTLNVPGVDAAVVGVWMWWLRTPGIDLEQMRASANRPRGEQQEPAIDAIPEAGKHPEADLEGVARCDDPAQPALSGSGPLTW